MDNFYKNNFNNISNINNKNENWDLDSYLFEFYGDNFYGNNNKNNENNKSINTNKTVNVDKYITEIEKDNEIRNLKTEVKSLNEDLADTKSELKYVKKKLYDYKIKADAFDKLFDIFKDKFQHESNYRNVIGRYNAVLGRIAGDETCCFKDFTPDEVLKIFNLFFNAKATTDPKFKGVWVTVKNEVVDDCEDDWGNWHFYNQNWKKNLH